MTKIYTISKSTTEVYSKQGGTKVVKFETQEASADTIKHIVRHYNYSACRWLSGEKRGAQFFPDQQQTPIGHCSNDSFAEMYGIILDVDEGLTMTEATTLFQDYQGCIFPSSSHQQEKMRGSTVIQPCDRFRILLPFHPDDYIIDASQARSLTKAALNKWQFADQSCVDPARKYFPTTGPSAEDAKFVFIELKGTRYLTPSELQSFMFSGHILDSETEDKKSNTELKKHNEKVPTFTLDDTIHNEEKHIIIIRELLDLNHEVNIYCPFCDDIHSMSRSAVFYPTNWKGIPSIFCQHCKSEGDGFNKNGLFYLNDDEAFTLVVERTGNIAFLDKGTNKIFFGAYDTYLDAYTIDQRDFRTLKNAMSSVYMPMPKVLPEVRYQLQPDSDRIVALEEGFVNRYIAPALLRELPVNNAHYKIPEYIGHLLNHLFPDPLTQEHFINWLATITQLRRKVITTFILQGVQGTGKNLLYDFIIKPIFGAQYCTEVHQNRFLSQFNTFITRSVWILINEAEIDFSQQGKKSELVAKLKPFITDSMLEAEAKGQDSKPERNNCNAIFFSNKRRSVSLERSDRRFNVCEYIEEPINKQSWWPGPSIIDKLQEEIREFCLFLKTFPINIVKAETTLKNKARKTLIELAETSLDAFFRHLKKEDFEWMYYALMEDSRFDFPNLIAVQTTLDLIQQKGFATRDELKQLYQNICGAPQITSQKFTIKCQDQGMELVRKQIDGVRTQIWTFKSSATPPLPQAPILPLD